MQITSLCYIEKGNTVLMLYRNKKKNDVNQGKWIGVGGKLETGETPETCMLREVKEETGLRLVSIDDVIGESYSAVGFSNEKNVCVVGTCEGEITGSDSSLEEIEAGWYTREEVRELLKDQKFAARTQAYCYLWSKE